MLTIQYLPYTQIELLNSQQRIQLMLSLLKNGKVILIDGRLSSNDEALLIRETMSMINEDFNGVEIGVMRDHKEKNWISKIKYSLAKALIGDRNGITLVGPAKIISELRSHPENVELHFQKEYLLAHSKPVIVKSVIENNAKSIKTNHKTIKVNKISKNNVK
jgi:hypothetical protein